ncbi:hypothetical protein EPN95_04765 [Patescibacteria group bacterium]|nr:MAG: hypothetical protein EPN95_04765 [Patescibacteria group bacterium]
MPNPSLLINGLDTVQCAYFMAKTGDCLIDFQELAVLREEARQSKKRDSAAIQLGRGEFLLAPHGTKSGYPFLITNGDLKIEFGEFNKPNFFVTFSSQALWRESAPLLHQRFLSWAESVGYTQAKPESLSRIDYCFDYHLPEMDFDEDCFKSRSTKDAQYRENGKAQTFSFGRGDIVLRVYDKVAEIEQQSEKSWFYVLWGRDSEVWRIEWQVRRPVLERFDIKTFKDFTENYGDLLRYLAEDHDTLRQRSGDSNSSRWPLHPLWVDLQERIRELPHMGILKVYGEQAALKDRENRIAQSVYGYLKRLAAIKCVQRGKESMSAEDALRELFNGVKRHHDPLTWKFDVEKRITEIRLGQW